MCNCKQVSRLDQKNKCFSALSWKSSTISAWSVSCSSPKESQNRNDCGFWTLRKFLTGSQSQPVRTTVPEESYNLWAQPLCWLWQQPHSVTVISILIGEFFLTWGTKDQCTAFLVPYGECGRLGLSQNILRISDMSISRRKSTVLHRQLTQKSPD